MKFKRNKYGDYLVDLCSNSLITQPLHQLFQRKKHQIVICRGRRFKKEETKQLEIFRLGATPRDGYIYGNKKAKSKFPFLIPPNIQESVNVCVFVNVPEKHTSYMVLVKPRYGNKLVNPSGSKIVSDLYIQDTVRREVKEKTCLTLDHSVLRPLAKWTCDTCFGGIQMLTNTWGFYSEVHLLLPTFLKENHLESVPLKDDDGYCFLPTKQTKLDVEEVEKIYFIDVKYLNSKPPQRLILSRFHYLLAIHAHALHTRKRQASEFELPNLHHVKNFEWTI
jgi:hypothetical protein